MQPVWELIPRLLKKLNIELPYTLVLSSQAKLQMVTKRNLQKSNNCRDMPCSWVQSLNIFRKLLPKLIYKVILIPTDTVADISLEKLTK